MADPIITPEMAAAHVAEHCPEPIELRTLCSRDVEYMCGCGHCPTPDPTAEQMLARVDAQWWRQMGGADG